MNNYNWTFSANDIGGFDAEFEQFCKEFIQEQQQPEEPIFSQTPLFNLLDEIPNETFELYPMN